MAGLRFGHRIAGLGASMGAIAALLAGQQAVQAQGADRPVADQSYHLPVAPPVYGADAYAWIDRANTLWDIIGDAPPDFGFVYGQVEPWVWTTGEGYWVITEPLTDGDGGVRGYYFRPGSRQPFLARLPDRSFAFEDGRLVMVYDRDGRALTDPISAEDADEASWLYLRGEQLRDAARDAQRSPVDSDAWVDAQPYFSGSIEIWDDGLRYEPFWNEYRMRPEIARWRRSIEIERERRRQRADLFLRWRRGGYVGAPPPGMDWPGRGDRHHSSGWHRVPGRWPGGGGGTPAPRPTPRPSPAPSPSVSVQPGQPAPPPRPAGWKGGYGAPAPGVVAPPAPPGGYRGGKPGGGKPVPVAAPPAPPPSAVPSVAAPPPPPPPPPAPPPAPPPSPAPPRSGPKPDADVQGGRNTGWRGGYPADVRAPAPPLPPRPVAAPPPPPRPVAAPPPPPRPVAAPPPPSAYRAPPRPAKVGDPSGRGDKPDR